MSTDNLKGRTYYEQACSAREVDSQPSDRPDNVDFLIIICCTMTKALQDLPAALSYHQIHKKLWSWGISARP